MSEEQTQAPEQSGGEQQAETPSWYFQAPNDESEGIGGSGEVPEWFKVDKYQSISEQAKAYNELATRFGGFEAAPKDDYALPEGIDENSLDGGMIDIVKGLGKEYNMSQKMFNDLVSKVNEYQSGQMEQNKQQAMEALGEKAQARISNVNDWLNVNAPKEMVEIIAPMATSAEAIKVLEFFIGKSKGAKVADQSTQPTSKMTQSEYGEMLMAKDNYGNLKISTDRDYKKKMDEMALNLQR